MNLQILNRNRQTGATDPLNHTTQWTYDVAGNKLTEQRPDASLTTFTYDSMNRVLTTTNALNQVTSYAYDAASNLTALTDANGHTYSFAYDRLNRRTAMSYPDTTQETWTYDAVGNVSYWTTRSGQITSYFYDSRNREYMSINQNTFSIQRVHHFNQAGQDLWDIDWPSNRDFGYQYDDAGRVVSEQPTRLYGRTPVGHRELHVRC